MLRYKLLVTIFTLLITGSALASQGGGTGGESQGGGTGISSQGGGTGVSSQGGGTGTEGVIDLGIMLKNALQCTLQMNCEQLFSRN